MNIQCLLGWIIHLRLQTNSFSLHEAWSPEITLEFKRKKEMGFTGLCRDDMVLTFSCQWQNICCLTVWGVTAGTTCCKAWAHREQCSRSFLPFYRFSLDAPLKPTNMSIICIIRSLWCRKCIFITLYIRVYIISMLSTCTCVESCLFIKWNLKQIYHFNNRDKAMYAWGSAQIIHQ